MANELRPKQVTDEMHLAAARITVAALVEARHLKAQEVEDAVRDLSRLKPGIWSDGYCIAKNLDDDYGWDCNFNMAEILDGHASELHSQLDAAEKAWAERVRPEPPLPLGTRICIRGIETGILESVYKYGPAKYCVKIDGEKEAEPPTNARRIINFEDAVAA